MANFLIKNLKGSRLHLPLPVNQEVAAYGTLLVSLPAGEVESSQLAEMVRKQIIAVTVSNDPDEDDNVEVSVNGLTRLQHIPMLSPTRSHIAGGTTPAIVVFGTTVCLQFSPNLDEAFRTFKLPTFAADSLAFHVHWTKSSDVDESGKNVRWQVEYTVFDGKSEDINNGLTGTLFVEDTYEDAGTTSRILHRTANVPIPDVPAGYYVSIRVMAVTPVGPALASEPALSTVDFTWLEYINA